MILSVSIIALILAGISKAIRDRVMTGYSTSKFNDWSFNPRWWDANISWSNKWKVDKNGKALPGKERFFLSSTVLVWLTDAWHFFDLIFMLTFGVGIWLAPFNPVIGIIISLGCFELTYSWLKGSKLI